MSHLRPNEAERDRARVMRVLRRVVGRHTGDDAFSMILSVALFAIGETELPVRGRALWAFVGAVAEAVEAQEGLAEADVVRRQLERELRSLFVEPRREEVSSGVREKVRPVDRTTVPVEDPLAQFRSPTVPAVAEITGLPDADDEEPTGTG